MIVSNIAAIKVKITKQREELKGIKDSPLENLSQPELDALDASLDAGQINITASVAIADEA